MGFKSRKSISGVRVWARSGLCQTSCLVCKTVSGTCTFYGSVLWRVFREWCRRVAAIVFPRKLSLDGCVVSIPLATCVVVRMKVGFRRRTLAVSIFNWVVFVAVRFVVCRFGRSGAVHDVFAERWFVQGGEISWSGFSGEPGCGFCCVWVSGPDGRAWVCESFVGAVALVLPAVIIIWLSRRSVAAAGLRVPLTIRRFLSWPGRPKHLGLLVCALACVCTISSVYMCFMFVMNLNLYVVLLSNIDIYFILYMHCDKFAVLHMFVEVKALLGLWYMLYVFDVKWIFYLYVYRDSFCCKSIPSCKSWERKFQPVRIRGTVKKFVDNLNSLQTIWRSSVKFTHMALWCFRNEFVKKYC